MYWINPGNTEQKPKTDSRTPSSRMDYYLGILVYFALAVCALGWVIGLSVFAVSLAKQQTGTPGYRSRQEGPAWKWLLAAGLFFVVQMILTVWVTGGGRQQQLETTKLKTTPIITPEPVQQSVKTLFEDLFTGTALISVSQFSSVYKVVERASNKMYVAKWHNPKPSSVKDLKQEAATLERLQGAPNIVQFVKFFPNDDSGDTLVMEYAGRENLCEVVSRLDPEKDRFLIIDLVRQLFVGLSKLDSFRIQHCDLTCENILVECGDVNCCTLTIVDFGLARDVGQKCMGTGPPVLSAPEVLAWNVGSTEKADVWAAAAVILAAFNNGLPAHAVGDGAGFLSRIGSLDKNSLERKEIIDSIKSIDGVLDRLDMWMKTFGLAYDQLSVDHDIIDIAIAIDSKSRSDRTMLVEKWKTDLDFADLYLKVSSGDVDVSKAPDYLQPLLRKCLNADPDQRPTAFQVLEDPLLYEGHL